MAHTVRVKPLHLSKVCEGMKTDPCLLFMYSSLMYQNYSLFTLCPTDHPNVRVFISHGGLLSTIEAAYVGVPMVGIPIFGDQSINIKAITDKKMGISLNYEEISKDSVLKAITTVLDEPRYATHCICKLLFKGESKSSLYLLITMPLNYRRNVDPKGK